MARRPKPTSLRQLQGNPGKRPFNSLEPKPEIGAPKMPKWLTGAARKEWRAIVQELTRTGVLARVEYATLTGYCIAWAQVQEAQKEVERIGLVISVEVQDKDGSFHVTGTRKNPACTVLDCALKQLRAFSSELGLSPSSRSKVAALPKKSEALSRAESYFTDFDDQEQPF
jgi:P27 family predicted phage terminase small subunit